MSFSGKISKRKNSGAVLLGTFMVPAAFSAISQNVYAVSNRTVQDASDVLSFFKEHWVGTLGVVVIVVIALIAAYKIFVEEDEEEDMKSSSEEPQNPDFSKLETPGNDDNLDDYTLRQIRNKKEGIEVKEEEEKITVVLRGIDARSYFFVAVKREYGENLSLEASNFIEGMYKCENGAKDPKLVLELVYNKKDSSFKVLDNEGNEVKSEKGEKLTLSSKQDNGKVKLKDAFLEKFGSSKKDEGTFLEKSLSN